jgi:hypothetical protein
VEQKKIKNIFILWAVLISIYVITGIANGAGLSNPMYWLLYGSIGIIISIFIIKRKDDPKMITVEEGKPIIVGNITLGSNRKFPYRILSAIYLLINLGAYIIKSESISVVILLSLLIMLTMYPFINFLLHKELFIIGSIRGMLNIGKKVNPYKLRNFLIGFYIFLFIIGLNLTYGLFRILFGGI